MIHARQHAQPYNWLSKITKRHNISLEEIRNKITGKEEH